LPASPAPPSAPSASASAAPAAAATSDAGAVALPGARGGIGFDDLRFAPPPLRRVIAPAGGTGRIDLVDPDSLAVTPIEGFSVSNDAYAGGHDFGVTSADYAHALVFATDRTSKQVHVVEPSSRHIVSSAPLAASPDYVRWVEPTHEIWVTEPDKEKIEIFSLMAGAPIVKHAAEMPVKGGPESLVVDATRGRAYTHTWKGATLAVDLAKRAVVATWPNGCEGSRGIALDEKRGLVFVGCAEGKAVVLDAAHDGKVLGSATCGAGVDVIDYAPGIAHLYVPGAKSATMAIFSVSAAGALALLGTVPTARGAHCVTADDRARAFVCDPSGAQLLVVRDSYQ
jgi:hypothetical protein